MKKAAAETAASHKGSAIHGTFYAAICTGGGGIPEILSGRAGLLHRPAGSVAADRQAGKGTGRNAVRAQRAHRHTHGAGKGIRPARQGDPAERERFAGGDEPLRRVAQGQAQRRGHHEPAMHQLRRDALDLFHALPRHRHEHCPERHLRPHQAAQRALARRRFHEPPGLASALDAAVPQTRRGPLLAGRSENASAFPTGIRQPAGAEKRALHLPPDRPGCL